jgi:DNA-binding NtrC family response regulator
MVYGFIKQSQGHIKIYSELGHGTSIKLYLPRAAEPEAAMPTSSPEGPPRLSHRGRRILVVEDDEAVRRYAVEMLGELGYTVRSASDSEAARRIIAEEPSFDLLFTDVGLPGPCNGRQLAAEARHRHPGLKVLFTTGYTRNAIVHNGILDRDVDLIGKPFTYEALAATVARVLDAA